MNGKLNAESGTLEGPPVRLVHRFSEAGQLLGGLTRKTVAKLVREGELETTRIGAFPMVTRASIDAYIQRGKQKSAA